MLSRGEGSLSSTCWQCSSKCSLIHCQPSLLQGHTAVFCPASCLPGLQGLSLKGYFPAGVVWLPGIIILQGQDLALPLSEHHGIPLSSILRPVTIPLNSRSFDVSATSHTFLSSVNLLGVHSVLLFRSLMKASNSVGPRTNPWSTPLLTCLQLDFMPLIITFWTQLLSQFSIYIALHLSNLWFVILSIRMVFETGSKVLVESM